MLFLLGGAARAGKSQVARRFQTQTGIPSFCLDYLMMGFAQGLPAYGVNPEDDELCIADRLWPVVRAMALAMTEDELDYLIEGVQLRPRSVAELIQRRPQFVRACFLGYAEIEPLAKARQLRAYGGGLDDWMRAYDDTQMLREVQRLIALSATLRDECAACSLSYFEVGLDLEATVQDILRHWHAATNCSGAKSG